MKDQMDFPTIRQLKAKLFRIEYFDYLKRASVSSGRKISNWQCKYSILFAKDFARQFYKRNCHLPNISVKFGII
jgi:hypothetical protein